MLQLAAAGAAAGGAAADADTLQKEKKAPSKLASPRNIMQHYTMCTNLHLLQLRSKRK